MLFVAVELLVLKVEISLLGLNQHTYCRSGRLNMLNAVQLITVVQPS